MRKWSVIRQWTVEAETAALALELALPGEHETVRVSVVPPKRDDDYGQGIMEGDDDEETAEVPAPPSGA
jgi:hypothetical protein